MRRITYAVWSSSSSQVTSTGRWPAVRSDQRFLVNRSRARPITWLAASRIGSVLR